MQITEPKAIMQKVLPLFLSLAMLTGLLPVSPLRTMLTNEAEAAAASGPRGGAAVSGPRGGTAVSGPRGGAAVSGPRGGAAAVGWPHADIAAHTCSSTSNIGDCGTGQNPESACRSKCNGTAGGRTRM